MKNKIFISIFFIVCLIPLLTMLIPADNDANTANEAARSTLSVKDENGNLNLSYLSDLSDTFDNSFGLRDKMISAYHKCIATIFGESAEDKVILGKDGWLFYTETLDDYQRTNKMTDRELYSVSRTVELIDEYFAEKGVEFIFTVAPNKNSLYGDMMPSYYKKGEGLSNGEALSQILKDSEVTYVDLLKLFRNENKVLYMKTDSHWTTEGAGLAADAILKAAEKENQAYYGSDTVMADTEYGDLYKMIYPSLENDEKDVVYTQEFSYAYRSPMRSAEDNFIRTECVEKDGNLFVFRDSFGNALYPFLADAYGKSTFCRLNPYNLALAENEGADTVIIEIVERNLDWLLSKPPIFPSPVRKADDFNLTECTTLEITASDDLPGYNKIEGKLSSSVSAGERILINAGDCMYEAIPCTEAAFVAYIPTDRCPDDVSVAISKITD